VQILGISLALFEERVGQVEQFLEILVPGRERANFVLRHVAPIFRPQQVLQQNAQRKRQMPGGDALLVESVQAVEFVFFTANFKSCACAKTIRRHSGLPSPAPARDQSAIQTPN